MDYNNEFKKLVDLIKNNARVAGGKIRNEDIAEKMGYTREHLSALINGKKIANESHIRLLKSHFEGEMEEVKKPGAPGDPHNLERAYLKAIGQRVAKLEALVTNRSLQEILKEIEQDTILALHDLERG